MHKVHQLKKFKTKLVLVLLALIVILAGAYFYFGGFLHTNLAEELGYIRGLDGKNGQYFVTFDSADWLFADDNGGAAEQSADTINRFSISPHLYFFLKANPNYFNNPASLYLNGQKEAVKIELIDETVN